LFSCSKNKSNDPIKKSEDSPKAYFEKYKLNQTKKKLGNDLNLDKSFELLKFQKNDLTNRNLLYNIILEFYKNNNYEKLDESSKLLLSLSSSSHDTLNLGMAYRSRGNFYFKIQKLDSCYYFYLKAEKIYFKLNDKPNYANILMNKGIVQYSIGNYLGAELSLNKAHSIFKETNIYNKIYGSLDQLGLVATELKEYEKGIFYFKKALEAINDLPLIEDKVYYKTVCQNNIGYLYLKSKEYEKGGFYFEEALKNKSIINEDALLYSNLIDNLAYCKLYFANTSNLSSLFFEALEIRKKLNNPTAVVGSYIHISEYFYKQNNINQAINYSLLALSEAKKSRIPLNIVLALKQSSVVDKKKAFRYTDEYIRINDSLQIAERKSRDRFARIELETDEISQENVDLEGRNRTLLYFLMFGGIIILFVFIIRYQRNRAKELLYLQSQQRANEEIFNLMASQETAAEETRNKEKKKIAKDIHDGVLGRMFGARMNLDSLNNNTDPESAEKRLAYLNELKIIEQDLREISHDLNREKQVLINNFVAIVNDLLEEQRNAFPSKVAFKISEDINWNNINNNIKINMYRILQEGLQNINKYANAKKIEVSINSDANNIILSIIDNGDGFDANKKKKGIGLQNMISRANDCRGTIDINSIKGEGTTIILTMPITKPS
jgi:signal transduction histidine kinase